MDTSIRRGATLLATTAWMTACAGLPGADTPLGSVDQVVEIQAEASDALLSGSASFLRGQGVNTVCLGVAAQGTAGTVMRPDARVRRIAFASPPERDREATRSVIAALPPQSFAIAPSWDCRPSGRAFVVESTGTEAVLVRVDSPRFSSTDLAIQTAIFDHEDFTYSMSCRVVLAQGGWFVDTCRCRRSRGPDACPSIR